MSEDNKPDDVKKSITVRLSEEDAARAKRMAELSKALSPGDAWADLLKSSATLPDLRNLRTYDFAWSKNIQLGDEKTFAQTRQLEQRISELKSKLDTEARKVRDEYAISEKKSEKISELEKILSELQSKQRLDFILNRVNHQAQKALLNSEDFQKKFLEQEECSAFVMSVDIRRSTELMLKARTPEMFAEFITDLCAEFKEIITQNYGVFDKFTGDGVLAFFPGFYSGSDAGSYAVNAAVKCHEAFKRQYKQRRNSFSSVLTDIGLGIGIDYGKAHLVQVAGGLTVVGVPVVYACRLGGAPAGQTLLNQPAFEQISERAGLAYFFQEESLEIKHEGSILAYRVYPSGTQQKFEKPDWLSLAESDAPRA